MQGMWLYIWERWKNLRKECWYKVTVDWNDFWAPYTRITKEQVLYPVLFNELKYCDYDGYKIKVEKIGEGLELAKEKKG